MDPNAAIPPPPVHVNPHAPGPVPANPDIDTIAEENASSQPSSLNTSQGDAGSEGYLKVQ